MPPKSANVAWLWGFVSDHRRSAILALLFGLIAGISTALEPYLIGMVIDRLEQGTDIDQILQLVFFIIGLAIITIAAFFGERNYSGEVAYAVNYDIRRVLFENMVTLENAFYEKYPTGDLISRMHADIVMIWRLLALTFSRISSAILMIIVTFVLLGLVNLPLTVIVFVVLAVTTSLQIRAGTALVPMFERVQDQTGVLSSIVQDSVSGIQTIKSTAKEDVIADRFYRENRNYRNTWLFFKRRNEPIGMLPNMISELATAIVVLIGGIMTINGVMSIGDFTSFIIYLALISQSLLRLGTMYQRFQQTRGALTRITPLLKTAEIRNSDDPKPISRVRGEIEFENVSIRIDGKWLLKNINLTIPAEKTVAIVGATGSGKTLLVNLIGRVLDPTSGTIRLDGEDIRNLDLDSLRRAIAYVPQTTFLFSQELNRNIRMGDESITDQDIDLAVQMSRLSNDLAQLPKGMDTLVGEKGVMLSGGQKQRLAIARAVVRDSKILVLDDALSSVDMHTAADILGDLRDILRTRTSIIIAHRIATVKDADHIIVLDDGEIAEEGNHHSLIEQNGLYARMVERELSNDVFENI